MGLVPVSLASTTNWPSVSQLSPPVPPLFCPMPPDTQQPFCVTPRSVLHQFLHAVSVDAQPVPRCSSSPLTETCAGDHQESQATPPLASVFPRLAQPPGGAETDVLSCLNQILLLRVVPENSSDHWAPVALPA